VREEYALPDARGVIHVPESGEVLFALNGLSSLGNVEGVHVMPFQTAAPSYLWVNDVVAVGEGTIDVEHARLAMHYYECGVEVPLHDLMS
jgi:hypothetical protein